MKQYTTILDIAERAGVSPATVSRVINNSDLVGKDTRKKVQKAIDEMEYIPNTLVRGVVQQATHTVALIVMDIANPFFSEIIHGVESAVSKQGYSMFLCNSNYSRETEKLHLMEMVGRRVDGIILISAFSGDNELIQKLLSKSIQLVSIQSRFSGIDRISTSDEEGMISAVEHLISYGHKKIAYVGAGARYAPYRFKAFTNTLTKYGIPLVPEYYPEFQPSSLYGENFAYYMTKQLLSLPCRPTAIQAMNDYLALGVYQALQEENLSVPRDMSVIGFDNIQLSNLLNPRLTTVEQPAYEMGKAAGELIVQKIQSGVNFVPRQISFETKLIVRDSVGKAAE